MGIDYNRRPGAPEPEPESNSGNGINYSKRPVPAPTPPPASAGTVPAATGANPNKVMLTKSAPSVSLTKSGTTGEVRINLNWDNGAASKGWFAKNIDLDLACLWEFADGSKGAVQALGNMFESPGRGRPVIRLDGDDRSGANTAGENLFIDLDQKDLLKRVLIFAFIYEGVPNWQTAKATATLYPATGPAVEVNLDGGETSSRFCAIALLENVDGEMVLRNEVHYIPGGQRAIDEEYGWGMQWAAGRK